MIDVGKGYRSLVPGDVLQEGDEWWNLGDRRWQGTCCIGMVIDLRDDPYRRPISQEKTEDADEG